MKKDNFEWNRQLFYIFLGLFIVLFLKFGFIDKRLILIATATGLALSYISRKIRIPVIHNLLQIFERKKELDKFPGKGIIFYFIGVYISSLLFTKEIAMASIMVLALGDSISHLFGLHFGKIKHPFSD